MQQEVTSEAGWRLSLGSPGAKPGWDVDSTRTQQTHRARRDVAGGRAALRRAARLVRVISVAAIAACSPGDGPSSPSQQQQSGTLQISIAGLPAGASASVVVGGPEGFSQSVGATSMLSGLALGTYSLTAQSITVDGSVYTPDPASQQVTVDAGGGSISVSVTYTLSTGSLLISASGVPASAVPSVALSGPAGYSATIAAGSALKGLTPGTYVATPQPVQAQGNTYAAVASPLSIEVTASEAPAVLPISYALTTGEIAVTIQGLPSGFHGSVTLSGPGGFQLALTADAVVTNLEPGAYTVAASPVTVGLDLYSAAPPSPVSVSASLTPTAVTVAYTLSSGRLTVTMTGLPTGVNGSVQVTGPGGFSTTLGATATLNGLQPGPYTITAAAVATASASYAPAPAMQQVTVSAGTTPFGATVVYAIASGSLSVAILGLPQGAVGNVSVSGPGGYSTTLTTTATLTNLVPGTYVVAGTQVNIGSHLYAPGPLTQNVQVSASAVAAQASVTYALASGVMSLSVTGLPDGVSAAVSVTGPGGYAHTATASELLLSLTPGTYVVAGSSVTSGASTYAPSPASQNVVIPASTVAVNVSVSYSATGGGLQVTINGLPGGVPASVSVTGPGGFNAQLAASQELSALSPGTYVVAAANVSNGGTQYTPSPTSQNAVVTASSTASATVTYASAAAQLNLTIADAYITQSVQTPAMDVPLVSGRNGMLRVFVTATQANSVQPAVRVRFYNGATLVNTYNISAPGASVPTSVNEGSLGASWNLALSGADLQPGISLLVDVDPTNSVAESSETDNDYPASGTPLALDVRTVSTYSVRLVPVAQTVNGNTGNVTSANLSQYLAPMLQMYPLVAIDADIRSTYTTSAPALQSGDGNGAWGQILSEVNALRTADGSSRYYYGVVHTSYTAGVAGLGFVPGKSAIGWDYLPTGAGVMAHETGHNFGRFHAPSCGAGGPDPNYPSSGLYAGGKIGVYGYDLTGGVLKAPTAYYDLMGYCNPTWISDYTYEGILDYRAAHPDVAPATTSAVMRPSLLVWGRIHNGQVILEPAYEVDTRPRLPVGGGPSTLTGYDASGQRLFSMAFTGERIADAPDPDDQTFAFAIPLDSLRGRSLNRLSLSALGRVAERRVSGPANLPVIRDATEEPVARRVSPGEVRVTWKDDGVRGVLIRDARSGDILAFGRGGVATVRTTAPTLDVVVSDGVRSAKRSLKPR